MYINVVHFHFISEINYLPTYLHERWSHLKCVTCHIRGTVSTFLDNSALLKAADGGWFYVRREVGVFLDNSWRWFGFCMCLGREVGMLLDNSWRWLVYCMCLGREVGMFLDNSWRWLVYCMCLGREVGVFLDNSWRWLVLCGWGGRSACSSVTCHAGHTPSHIPAHYNNLTHLPVAREMIQGQTCDRKKNSLNYISQPLNSLVRCPLCGGRWRIIEAGLGFHWSIASVYTCIDNCCHTSRRSIYSDA